MGRKGTQFLTRTRRELVAEFPLTDRVALREIRPAADFLVGAFLEGQVDTVEVIYAQFVNTLTQMPVNVPLLPLTNIGDIVTKLRGPKDPAAPSPHDLREMLFEPDATSLLGVLLPMFITGELHQFALAAKASEHSARMVAMKTAKDNATKLLERSHPRIQQGAPGGDHPGNSRDRRGPIYRRVIPTWQLLHLFTPL